MSNLKVPTHLRGTVVSFNNVKGRWQGAHSVHHIFRAGLFISTVSRTNFLSLDSPLLPRVRKDSTRNNGKEIRHLRNPPHRTIGKLQT
jgi:hypothetical protein